MEVQRIPLAPWHFTFVKLKKIKRMALKIFQELIEVSSGKSLHLTIISDCEDETFPTRAHLGLAMPGKLSDLLGHVGPREPTQKHYKGKMGRPTLLPGSVLSLANNFSILNLLLSCSASVCLPAQG